jgi:hypothetical protein
MSDPSLQAYAETLNVISKQDAYINPQDWDNEPPPEEYN